jgi:(p)ppGpp synthase/HD superfamily hydrolase
MSAIVISEQITDLLYNDDLINKARNLAYKLHGKNFFYNHLERVVRIGVVGLNHQGFTTDELRDLICAFNLHDAPEDKGLTWEYMKSEFNERIANLTFEVKKDETGEFPRLQSYFGHIVKLADRFANYTSEYLRTKNPAKIEEYTSTLKHAFDTKQKLRK